MIQISLMSCKGPEGEKGDTGEQGNPGGTITEFTGYIPGDGSLGTVSIGSSSLPTNTTVTVYYAIPEFPTVWIELGHPQVDDGFLLYPWCAVSYGYAGVAFYNCSTSWLYKIIVFVPTSSSLGFVRPFDFLFGY